MEDLGDVRLQPFLDEQDIELGLKVLKMQACIFTMMTEGSS